MTPQLRGLLGLADGRKSGADLVDELAGEEGHNHETAQSLVHEAISYGLLVPTD